MTTFDLYYLSLFKRFKPRFKQKANTIASLYVSLLQIGLVLLIGAFFSKFIDAMHVKTMAPWKAWTFFAVLGLVICFRNWMFYSGKKRMVLNAKLNKKNHNLIASWQLVLLLFGVYLLALIIINA